MPTQVLYAGSKTNYKMLKVCLLSYKKAESIGIIMSIS